MYFRKSILYFMEFFFFSFFFSEKLIVILKLGLLWDLLVFKLKEASTPHTRNYTLYDSFYIKYQEPVNP